MRTIGHTLQRATKREKNLLVVTLECSCGKVFATRFCVPAKENETHQAAYADGWLEATKHITTMSELAKTIQAGQPCAA